MIIYCLKCKQETETIDQLEVQSKKSKEMIKGSCSICGTRKSVFISSSNEKKLQKTIKRKGFSLNNLINNLPIELHQYAEKGEYFPGGSFNDQQKYSYCGPGTRYKQRVREGYKGINELDKMCKLHDQFYNENKDTKDRNISDVALAHSADEIANDSNFDDVQRKYARFISSIMKAKAHLGLGVNTNKNKNTKNSKRRPGTSPGTSPGIKNGIKN